VRNSMMVLNTWITALDGGWSYRQGGPASTLNKLADQAG